MHKKRGDYWEYSFEGATIDKKRNRITKSGFNTENETFEAGHKALAEYNEKGMPFKKAELSFSDFLDFGIDEFCKINLKNTTIRNYQKKLRKMSNRHWGIIGSFRFLHRYCRNL